MRSFFSKCLWVYLSFFFLSAGCVSYRAAPLYPTQTLSDFEARRLNDSGLKQFLEQNLKTSISPWPPKVWTFPMLTLVAFYYHPDLDVARAKWGVAKAGVVTAGGRPNPTISLSPEYAFNSDIGKSPYLLGFNFDIPIETAGKRGYRISQAKKQSEMAQYNIATVAWQVRSRLRKNLLNLYTARQRKHILKEQLHLQEENVHVLENRVATNSMSPILLSDARLQQNQTLLSLRDEEKRESEALVQVAQALGISVNALKGINFSLNFFDRIPKNIFSSQIRRDALLNRPDILAALSEYASAEAGLQLEIAKQYPDVHISPGYTFDQGENKWMIGFSITPPLFNRNEGPIAEAKARRTETAARFIALQAQVIGEIDQSWVAYQSTLKKLKTADDLLGAQKNKTQLIKSSANLGELRRVSLLQNDLELDTSVLIRLNVLLEVQQSLNTLEDSVQQPLGEESLSLKIGETNPREKETQKP